MTHTEQRVTYEKKEGVYYMVLASEQLLYKDGLRFLVTSPPRYLTTCYPVKCNGFDKLIFDQRGLVPLLDYIRKQNFESFLSVLIQLKEGLNALEDDYYVHLSGLRLSLDSMGYCDVTKQVKLLYFPLSEQVKLDPPTDFITLSNEIRGVLKNFESLQQPFASRLKSELSKNPGALKRVLNRLSEQAGDILFDGERYDALHHVTDVVIEDSTEIVSEPERQTGKLMDLFKRKKSEILPTRTAIKQETTDTIALVMIQPASTIKLTVTTSPFEVGSLGPEYISGSLQGVQGISRRHFKITRGLDGNFWIEDMSSTNGTFLNDVPLTPNHPVKLTVDHIIEVANVKFKVIKEGDA